MSDSDEPREPAAEDRNLAPFAAAFEAGLGVVAVILGAWVGVTPGATLDAGARSSTERCVAVAWGLAAAIPPLVGLRLMQRSSWRPFVELQELVDRQVVPWFAQSTWWELAILAVAAGFGEELLFRGLIQVTTAGWLPEGLGATLCGLVVSALLFGVCHALNRTYFALATGMSLYLGVLFLIADDLTAPIVAHAVYDFLALLWLAKRAT